MKTKNALIIWAVLTGSIICSTSFADTSTGSLTDSGSVVTNTWVTVISSWSLDAGTWTMVSSTWSLDTSAWITSTGVTSTGVTSTWVIREDRNKINDNRNKILESWSKFHDDYGFIKQFLKKPTTKAELKTLTSNVKSDLKSYHEAVKALIKEWKEAVKTNSFDPVAFNAKVNEILSKQTETLSKYVDPAKIDAFKKFMDEKRAVIMANEDLRKANFELRQEIKEIKKKIFSDNQRKSIANTLAKKEKLYLQRLLNVIDVYSSKAKTEKLKDQLEELKQITQERIEAIK
ncbi:MAG: hypothetical protein ACD_3C00067G0008 [uncultured bacterium (gcode 4)]|uniref:Uncharacterized protein n=1 Tax=uncultured bacterium (gcode 4) TaxID=1234023 RepID=K2GDL5_9BACT|nr:MAG: hypothetical protein ACD_3C00067G0008 [uncultured bacterium (gcode 4)]